VFRNALPIALLLGAALSAPAPAATAPAAAAEMPPAKEGPTGLAARHPMDRGIASNPAVIFFDGFEDGNWKQQWYKENVRWRLRDVERVTGEDVAFTGTSSCKLVLAPGKLYGSCLGSGKLKPGWEVMHLRWYVRFSDNYTGGKHGTTTALDSKTWVPGASGKRPSGTDKANSMVCFSKEGLGQMYYYNLDQRGVWGSGGKQNVGGPVKLANGKWHCLEIASAMNTPGQKDGWQRLWINGKLKGEWKSLRWRTADSLKWNSWCFLIGSNNKAPGAQHLLLDNVVVATEYIGTMVKQAPKAAASPKGTKLAPVMTEDERRKSTAEKDAARLLQMARTAERMGQRSVARSLYRQIVEKHPDTDVAKRARSKLD